MTASAPALATVAALFGAAALVAAPAEAARTARLQGTWTMRGLITRAEGVRGEHRGQRVRRSWTFTSHCLRGACKAVNLDRERALGQVQHMTLHATGRGHYLAHGQFAVPLRCAGRVDPRGAAAYTVVHVTILRAATVQTTPFATAIRAAYTNPRRTNRTRCPGTLGRDAAVYSGQLSTPLPAPPVAEFSSSPDPVTGDVAFADESTTSNGAAIAVRRWDFGDPASGTANTSADTHPVHHYSVPGSYQVTLKVRDANGLTETVTRHVNV